MIDVNEIAVGDIAQLRPGQICVPSGGGDPFVGGIVATNVVAAALNVEEKFHIAQPEHWDRPLGTIYGDARFEVDESSASHLRRGTHPEIGSLVVGGGGLWLFAASSQTARHFVSLREADEGVREDALAFSKWRIVRGQTDELQVLFAKD